MTGPLAVPFWIAAISFCIFLFVLGWLTATEKKPTPPRWESTTYVHIYIVNDLAVVQVVLDINLKQWVVTDIRTPHNEYVGRSLYLEEAKKIAELVVAEKLESE